jgi:hypothetical protein
MYVGMQVPRRIHSNALEDLMEIRVGTLEFDTRAVELIRAGIEKRVTAPTLRS